MRSHNGEDCTIRFSGSEGWLFVKRGKFEASKPEILRERPEGGIELATSNNHIGNFPDCLRSGKEPITPVEVGHRSNTVCLLHYISMKLGRTVRWDPAHEQFIGDAQATALLSREYREDFTLKI